MIRIATLNIRHGGGNRVQNIVSFIHKLSPDCILLTEYRNNLAGHEISKHLFNFGYTCQSVVKEDPKVNQLKWFSRLSTFEAFVIDEVSESQEHSHRLSVLKLLDIQLIGVYFPQGLLKAPMFDFIQNKFPIFANSKSAVIGDFNTGLHWVDEAANTFKCVKNFEAMMSSGWIDAWRSRNPESREFSWYSNKGNGFRIDHALLSPLLNQSVQRIFYLNDTIQTKTSDHGCLVIDVLN